LIVEHCQRFTEGRESRRPAGELIKTSAYDVAPIGDVATAKAFIRAHHYIKHASPTPHRFGLYLRGELVGVSLFGPPASKNAHDKVFPTLTMKNAVTFGRLVLLEDVPGNGESWFIARCFDLLRQRGIKAVESCADPEPRMNAAGVQTFKGHLGIVYQATNAAYIGKTNDNTQYWLPDGTVLSHRSQSKLRSGERGDDHPIAQLVAHGAAEPSLDENMKAWLKLWRARICRSHRHRGNYRYLWALDRRVRKDVLDRFTHHPYPKLDY
jgi:hypothetical protein